MSRYEYKLGRDLYGFRDDINSLANSFFSKSKTTTTAFIKKHKPIKRIKHYPDFLKGLHISLLGC